MRKAIAIMLLLMPLCVTALPQTPRPGDDQPVRISTELVQIDVVTTDKELLRRAIAGLTPATHPLSAFHNPETPKLNPQPSGTDMTVQPADQSEDIPDTDNPLDDTNRMLRSYMSLATAGFVIDSMK